MIALFASPKAAFACWTSAWHLLLLFVLGSAWGLQFVLLKIATDAGLGEANILLVSMTLLALGFLVATAAAGAWFRATWRHVRFFLISGTLGFVLPLGAVLLAAREISAGVIVLFEALTPVFTLALALILRTEAVTPRRVLTMTLGLLGVFAILLPAIADPGSMSLVAIGFALALPVIYALECVYVGACWPSDLRPLQVVTGETVASAIMLLPCLLWLDGVDPVSMARTFDHGAVLLFVLISVFEIYLYYVLIRRAGAVFVSLGSLISMFAGILFGILLIGESHPASVWLAVALAALALSPPLRKKSPEPAVAVTASAA